MMVGIHIDLCMPSLPRPCLSAVCYVGAGLVAVRRHRRTHGERVVVCLRGLDIRASSGASRLQTCESDVSYVCEHMAEAILSDWEWAALSASIVDNT
jgi:hypothetical protein